MNINRKNYESWFIDYSDGTLTAEQRAELLLFLEQHPDLKAEFENFVNEPIVAMNESLPDSFTSSLKRGDVNESNLNYYLIASMEGDLSAQEQNKLDAFLQKNPAAAKQQQLVALTRLQPVEEVFPGKRELKKPVPMVFGFTRVVKYAVAAMLVLTVVAGSYVIYTKTVSTPAVQMAEDQSSFDSSALSKDLKSDPAIQVRIEGSVVGSNEDQLAVGSNQGGKDTVNQKTNVVKDEVKRELNRQRILQRTRPEYPLAQQQELPREEVQPKQEQQLPVEQPKPEENLAMQQPAETGQPALASNSEPAAGDEYVSVWDAIRGSAEKKARRFAGQDEEEAALAAAAGDRRSRPRLLDLIGKGVEKVSKEKVKYDSQYDSNGNLSALNVDAGWFGIEKTGE